MNIRIALRRFREAKGISQEKLAIAAGFDRTYISMLERGTRKPSLETLDKIAKALKVKSWEILLSIDDKTICTEIPGE